MRDGDGSGEKEKVTKRSPEQPKVLLERKLGGWGFFDGFSEEQCQGYAIGAIVEAQFWQNRSLPQLRIYWATLSQCVFNSEGKYGSAEDLHEVLKIALGYTRQIDLLLPGENAGAAAVVKVALETCNKILKGCQWIIRRTVGTIWITPLIDDAIVKATAAVDLVRVFEQQRLKVTLPGSISFSSMDQAQFKIFCESAFSQLRRAGYPIDDYIEQSKIKLARVAKSNSRLIPTTRDQANVQNPVDKDQAPMEPDRKKEAA